MADHNVLGNLGEERAQEYLSSKGFNSMTVQVRCF